VLAWVAAQPRALLYTTHINQAESSMALAACPKAGGPRRGRQRQRQSIFVEDFARRILPFEAGAAPEMCAHVAWPACPLSAIVRHWLTSG
jgi:hypothetical protein